jgi:perosamine synthetase
MLQPSKIEVSDLGDRASVIPRQDPPLQLSVGRIPISQNRSIGKIIPVCEPVLSGNEQKYVAECVESGWISSAGSFIERFESGFAGKIGTRTAVATTSGTTALHLALAVLGIGPGDEVILPTFTMIATIHGVTHLGATPILVDAHPRTWTMDVSQVESKITPRTKAVIAVHIYGYPCDMDELKALGRKHGIYVVEDAAEVHGARYKGKMCGSLADIASFSFYANKIITTGEGGMVTTDNEELGALCRVLRDHAFSKERHFWHRYHGYNFRMSNMQAAVGVAQLERWDELVQARIDHARRYIENLKDVPGLVMPPESDDRDNVFWMFGLRVKKNEFGIDRDELRRRLASRAVETRTFFIPMHLQPAFFEDFKGERFPESEALCGEGLYLPSSAKLTNDEIDFVCECIRECKC